MLLLVVTYGKSIHSEMVIYSEWLFNDIKMMIHHMVMVILLGNTLWQTNRAIENGFL